MQPLARVVASASTRSIHRSWESRFAIPKAPERPGLTPQDIDVWEVHEAYASVAVAILRELPKQLDGFRVPDEKLNPNGGRCRHRSSVRLLGHAVRAHARDRAGERRARYGVLGVCVGSGQGVAPVLEHAA